MQVHIHTKTQKKKIINQFTKNTMSNKNNFKSKNKKRDGNCKK